MPMLEHRSLCDLAYDQLLDEILSGKRQAGEKLGEEKLAADYGISRTPAREAMQRLIQDGLIEHKPRCGCFVKSVDREDIVEAFECRQEIECLALSNGFDNLTPEILKEGLSLIAESNTKAESNTDDAYELSLKADDCIHEAINEACHNRYLRDLMQTMQRKTLPFRRHRTLKRQELAHINTERQSMLQAMLDGDRALAIQRLKDHLLQGVRLNG